MQERLSGRITYKAGLTENTISSVSSPDVRLACAIRWFSGGSPYDMMTSFGISHTETLNSYWYVIDAVHKHPRFTIKYPKDHNAQHAIALVFHKVSRAGFKCCAGVIDDILIWIHKPLQKDCMGNGCDKDKFYCGRKKTYGLNCQAVCNVKGQILEIPFFYTGSTSDCLAFESMSLFQKLEEGILKPGLCMFGNNAYLNTPLWQHHLPLSLEEQWMPTTLSLTVHSVSLRRDGQY